MTSLASVSQRVFATGDDVSAGLKAPRQEFTDLSTRETGSAPLSQQRRRTEKSRIVLNGRKRASVDQDVGGC